jgi:uncharacterized membrane protein YgcG
MERRRSRSLAIALVCIAGLIGPPAVASASGSVHDVPATVAADCSVDVTQQLRSWIASVPDGSTLRFGADACYRIDDPLRVDDRWGLTFDGRGAVFRAFAEGDQGRRHFWFFGGGNLTIQDLTVVGSNPHAGLHDAAYRADRAFQHAFALQGVQGATLQRVQAYDVFGDFVYLGPDGAGHRRPVHGWSKDIRVVDSTFARNGRQGIATVAAEDVLIARNDIREVRRGMFNFEPTLPDWGARRVVIEDNVTGPNRLLWLASTGHGSNVSDIVVRRNVMVAPSGVPVIHVVAPPGERRGPFVIEDNDFQVVGSPEPGFRFTRVDDVRIVDNRGTFPANRAMTAIGLDDVQGYAVANNQFTGQATVLSATGSTPKAPALPDPEPPVPADDPPADAPGGSGNSGGSGGSNGSNGSGGSSGSGGAENPPTVGVVSFTDVPRGYVHAPAIERLAAASIVSGCAPKRYCPNRAVTRGDLSAFLAAALKLDLPAGAPPFRDVSPSDPNARAIAAVRARGLLHGYDADRFGPSDPLTRGQLASVLVRAFDLPRATSRNAFVDVGSSYAHATAITRVVDAGLARGCGNGRGYCPNESVTRGQIATFLDRALQR